MRHNGVLYNQILTEGGLNEWDEPVAAVQSWDRPIPCVIKTNSDTRKGKYDDGKFRQASFTILIEGSIGADLKRIKLRRGAEALGEFDVISIEPLTTVGRTQIIV